MKDFVRKGSDFLSAEETLGVLLDRLGVIGENEHGNAIITKDIVIEARLKRNGVKRRINNSNLRRKSLFNEQGE